MNLLNNATISVPKPVNEPILSYIPGSAERAGLNPIPTGGVKVWINPQSKGLAIEVTM